MYSIDDNKAYIKIIQRYLNLNQNGIIDKYTKAELVKFKSRVGLDSDMPIGYREFEQMKADYKERIYREKYGIKKALKRGDRSETVLSLNNMLTVLSASYYPTVNLTRTDYFNIATERAVAYLCAVFHFSYPGFVDGGLYHRIFIEYKAYNLFPLF